jgi:predicted RNA-binding Zn-ribbon protein involved in translation (DUF1610 family)
MQPYREWHLEAAGWGIIVEQDCPECGNPAEYEAYRHEATRQRREFYICRKCDTAQEI